MKRLDLLFTCIGFLGLLSIAILAVVDSHSTDIVSGVIVQLLFASLFISGYISYSSKRR
jgi:uncharacterized membrane protein